MAGLLCGEEELSREHVVVLFHSETFALTVEVIQAGLFDAAQCSPEGGVLGRLNIGPVCRGEGGGPNGGTVIKDGPAYGLVS